MRYIPNADFFIRIVQFPVETIGGMVIPNPDGTFSIYLNENWPEPMRRKALAHELEHIQNDDFYNGRPIQEIEDI